MSGIYIPGMEMPENSDCLLNVLLIVGTGGLTMAEYRDLTEILTLAKDLVYRMPSSFYNGIVSLLQEIIKLPAADVAPVRHGRWIWDEDGMDWGIGSWRCSECRARPETWWQGERSSPLNKSGHYYCPNCGAKMDGGGE